MSFSSQQRICARHSPANAFLWKKTTGKPPQISTDLRFRPGDAPLEFHVRKRQGDLTVLMNARLRRLLTRNWHSSEANLTVHRPRRQGGRTGLREERGGLRGHLHLDCQDLSVQPCGGNAATSYHRPRRQGRFSELDVVSCARNVLQEHLGRRVAMAAPVRCNPFKEHQDFGDRLTCISSSAEHVACGTLKKAPRHSARQPIVGQFWRLELGAVLWAAPPAPPSMRSCY